MIKNKKSVRLPNYIKPKRYKLTLRPDLEAFIFEGKEIIDIEIAKNNLKEIIIHSKDLDIETVKIQNQFANKIIYNIKNETATFYFKKPLVKGSSKLSIIFSGVINDKLRGFYKSQYILDGKTKHLATTQFEATDARRALPCFDEPAYKATFDVSLIVPITHTAISNTLPISIREHEAGYKIISFARTPKMSTYLLAFIIGEFEFIQKKIKLSGKDTLVRVFTTAGKKHQAKFALDVAIKSVKFFNKYFDIPYPLPTLDLIAIPDFESAAMENWGAITFRESALLVDEEHTSFSNKQWVAIVIAHELAHQWFGNLVTMHWWTDLWLNEGFASYMENVCVNHMFPKWNIWNLNLAGRHDLAFRLDSLESSHPVEIEVHHPDEISEVFDMISYSKGSAIIKMLAGYLGEEKFRDGLRYYLKKHSYKNTETIHLWEAFEKISKKPVKKLMNSWTKQTGYPLITISSRSDLGTNNNRKKDPELGLGFLAQERFFSSRISRKNNKIKNLWNIPISYNNKQILLTKKETRLKEKIIGKINKEEISFLRVKYNKENLEYLKKQIQSKKIKTSDRFSIVRDLFALAEGGYIPTTEALNFSLNFKKETEYIVWSEISTGINRIYNLISDESFKDQYSEYVLNLFSPLAEKIGWNKKTNEKHSDSLLRSLALSQAGSYGDKKIIKKAQQLFKNKKPIEANLRSTIYNIVAQNGGEKEWEKFKKLYQKEEMHEEKDRYGQALTSFRKNNLIQKTLKFALSKDVRNQDAPYIIAQTWANKYGRDLTWRFIKNNYKTILKRYGEGGGLISRMITPLGNHIRLKDLNDAKKFFTKNTAPGADRSLNQAYEKIASNSAWLKADKNKIKKWLENER